MTPPMASEAALTRRLSRRSLIRNAGLAAAGLAGAALVGCSGNDDDAGSDAMALDASPTAEMIASPSPTSDVASGMADDAEAMDAMLGEAREFALVSGWYRGEEARYYDFGMTSPASGSAVAVAPIYLLVAGRAADGSPIPIEGQHNIVDVVPGDEGYSDLWEVMLVTVEPGYEPDSIRSKADIDAAGLDVVSAGVIVNCPIVPAGSAFEDGEPLVQGWYRGERVFYPDFGENPPAAIPLWAFATGVSADGTPMFVEGQHNIIDSVPGMPGYSAFWRVMLVMVDEKYAADSVRSASEVTAAGFEVVTTDMVVNCPVVSPTA